jgi:hypothetical protein
LQTSGAGSPRSTLRRALGRALPHALMQLRPGPLTIRWMPFMLGNLGGLS